MGSWRQTLRHAREDLRGETAVGDEGPAATPKALVGLALMLRHLEASLVLRARDEIGALGTREHVVEHEDARKVRVMRWRWQRRMRRRCG
jgi:hypothetical protein